MMHPEQEVLLRVEETGTAAMESAVGQSHAPTVVLRGLRKSFGSQIVLDGIDLTVGGWRNFGRARTQRHR
jgi:hypothetical protein